MTTTQSDAGASVRFPPVVRFLHWTTAALVLVLLFTGASMYAGPISSFIGRRALMKQVHIISGLLLPLPLLIALAGPWRGPVLADARELDDLRDGKFRRGQKLNAALVAGALPVMFGTGMVLWQFHWFSDAWRTGATFVHDWTFIGLGILVAAHIWLAINDRDALQAMLKSSALVGSADGPLGPASQAPPHGQGRYRGWGQDRVERAAVLGAISYDPLVKITIGSLSISPHGIGIAVGFLLGARLMLPAARRKGISDETVYALLTRAAIGSIIGARVAYVVNHLDSYDSIWEALKIWKGGISLLGGFFGAILAALPAMKRYRLSFWKVMDAAAPGMALGVIFGRIGDLIVADHLGKPTEFFLGYKCPGVDVDTASPCVGTVVHHTALYDLLLTMLLLALLLWLRRRMRWDGFLITVFGLVYGLQRVVEDFLREDTRRFGLTGSQWTTLLTAAVCIYALAFVRRTPRFGDWEEPEPEALDVGENGEPAAPAADTTPDI